MSGGRVYQRDDLNRVNWKPITELVAGVGFESGRRNNLFIIDDELLLFAAGNTIQTLHMVTGERTYLKGLDVGIGAISIHPSRKWFAVGMKAVSESPYILIFEYPSLDIVSVLRGGTEFAFADMSFSADGELLATVGGAPDYTLSVWNWEEERLVLRSRAFGQDVYRVTFSHALPGRLTTSGSGHVKFWQMASTFTGLKLKGVIGKFGRVEISDIHGYAEMPDGKVLSGSESGHLLLWEENLVKSQITKKDGSPCHDGAIECVFLVGDSFVSGGEDGYLRYWNSSEIDVIETEIEKIQFEMDPKYEFFLGEGVNVKGMLKIPDGWIVQNANGTLLRVQLSEEMELLNVKELLKFHAGAVNSLVTSPVEHFAISGGNDGILRLFDVTTQNTLYTHKSNAAVTYMSFRPACIDDLRRSIICGYSDGVVRVMQICEKEFDLLEIVKPHTGPIVGFEYSEDGQFFASASRDKTVFFFSRSEGKLSPTGFVQLDDVPVSLNWKKDANAVLVCMKGGRVVEIQRPESCADGSSFETTDVHSKDFLYTTTMKKSPSPTEKTEEEKEDGEEDSVEDEEGEDTEVDEAEVDTLEKEEDVPEEETKEEEEKAAVGDLLFGRYTPDGGIFLSFDMPNGTFQFTGVMWSENGNSEENESPLLDPCVMDSGIFTHGMSTSGKLKFCGTKNGLITIKLTDDSESLYGTRVHDGLVTSVCSSFDDSYLVSSGEDGIVFFERIQGFDPTTVEAPTPFATPSHAIDDSVTSQTYSLEEERQKAERESLEHAAERKKETMREKIHNLKQDFLRLVDQNREIPGPLRIPRADFDVDPEMTDSLRNEAENKEDRLRKMLAFESERRSIALRKLKEHFVGELATQRIVLKAFNTGRVVSSFRTLELSPELRKDIEEVHALIEREESRIMQSRANLGEDNERSENVREVIDMDESYVEGESKAEARRRLREERRKQMGVIMERRPDEHYEDPQDVAAIEWAQKNMGDYKLKLDENYIVPEHQRVNAEKKRRQIVLLEESIFTLRMDFNERLLALRDLKTRIVSNVKKDISRIREINDLLAVNDPVNVPEIDAEEMPESREEYDDATLQRFEKRRAKEEKKRQRAEKARAAGGFGGFGGGQAEEEEVDSEDDEEDEKKQEVGTLRRGSTYARLRREVSQRDRLEKERMSRIGAIPMSEMETEEQQAEYERLKYERSRLTRKIEKTLSTFDDAVDELREEKFKLDADLISTSLKLILLYEELSLLKDFEKRDVALFKRQDEKRKEKIEVITKIMQCQERLSEKKVEIEGLLEKEKKLMSDFSAAVADESNDYDLLLRIFRAKVKKKATDFEDTDAEDDMYMDDDIDYDADSDYMEEEEEDLSCPPGCSQEAFERVLELRHVRAEQEEMLAEFQRSVEALKKENDGLISKERVVNTALGVVEKEIQNFQNEKQQKLNELNTVVLLKYHQVQNLDERSLLRESTEGSFVFALSGLDRLAQRIQELQQEKEDLRNHQKELKKQSVQLTRSRREKETIVQQAEAKLYEVQLLKFGQEVDIDALESFSVDVKAVELRNELHKREAEAHRTIAIWEKRQRSIKHRYRELLTDHTTLLDQISGLREKARKLEAALDVSQKTSGAGAAGEGRAQREEKEKMKEIVIMQAREIEAIRQEIGVLRRKGGHVYAPVGV